MRLIKVGDASSLRFHAAEFQHVFQAGWLSVRQTFFPDVLQAALTHHHTVEPIVMTNNGLLAASTADVELKAVNAVFQGEIESGDCVFRRVKPGAAMSEQ